MFGFRMVMSFVKRALRRFYKQIYAFSMRHVGQWKCRQALRKHAKGGDVLTIINLYFSSDRASLEAYAFVTGLYSTWVESFDLLMADNQQISSSGLREYVSVLGALSAWKEGRSLVCVAGYVARLDCPNKYRRRLKYEVVRRAISFSKASELVLILEHLQLSNELSEHQRVKVLSRLVGHVSSDVFFKWYSLFSSELGHAAQVKFKMYSDEVLGRNDFCALERAFCRLDTNLSCYYRDKLMGIFCDLPEGKNYIDARYSEEKTRALRQVILEKLIDKEPYAYMRLGDGEAYAFFGDGLLINGEGIERQERHWWGTALDSELRNSIIDNFHAGLAEADILGVPTVSRLIRDFNLKETGRYPVNSVISRLLAVMEGVRPHIYGPLIVEDRSNLFVFDRSFLTTLCDRAEKVVVLSGLTDAAMRECIKDEKATFISIPTHQRLRGDRLACADNAVLPFVYQDYLTMIGQHAGPGVLFLVSAGFIGKIFVAEARRRGSVVVDVGQLMFSIAAESRTGEGLYAAN